MVAAFAVFLIAFVALPGLVVPAWVAGYKHVRRSALAAQQPSAMLQRVVGVLAWGIVAVYYPLQSTASPVRSLRGPLTINTIVTTLGCAALWPSQWPTFLLYGSLLVGGIWCSIRIGAKV